MWCHALSMDRHLRTRALDLDTMRLEVLELLRPWQQAQVLAGQQAEVQVLDSKVLQLVSEDQVSLAVAHRPASLQASHLPVSLLLALGLLVDLLALHLPLAAVDSHLGERTWKCCCLEVAVSCPRGLTSSRRRK